MTTEYLSCCTRTVTEYSAILAATTGKDLIKDYNLHTVDLLC